MQNALSAMARKAGISVQEEREIRQALGDDMFEIFIANVMQKKEQKHDYHPESSPARRRARNPDWKVTVNQDQGKDRERRFDLVA